MGTVSLKNIKKSYGSTDIVEDLTLDFPEGSFTVLVGPSGCGKSTTLRMIAGLETVSAGQVKINDKDVTGLDPKDRDVAMVFQNYALYPHLTVLENIAFPLRATKTPRGEARKKAQDVAESLGLGHLTARKPKDLSGGQQQRVAIGRAIIREPAVFLFDEPLSNLDAKLRVETRSELLALQRNLGVTSIYVTHDQEEAMTLSDRMVVMKDGKIAQLGSPLEVYSKPNSVFVATFVGSPKMTILRGVSDGQNFRHEGGSHFRFSSEIVGPVLLGVRPEEIVLEPSNEGQGRIEQIELLGPRAVITVSLGETNVVAVVEAQKLMGMSLGSRVAIFFREYSAHLFDQSTELRLN
jgi:multiple sugar transport system ATP-binding protein